MSTSAPRAGKIYTFYSYKGGTGRSMVLANVAWILASNGRRVLVIDWDLEAPGLHRYFHPFLKDPELRSTHGLMDYVVDYEMKFQELAHEVADAAGGPGAGPGPGPDLASEVPGVASAEPARGGVVAYEEEEEEEEEEEPPPIPEPWRTLVRTHAGNVHLYVQPLRAEIPRDGEIDFLPAGLQGPHYATRVNSFDWAGLYERRFGWELLEAIKDELRAEYDYVLVDSRTGVSDTSGICTVQLPDALVACFTLNNQGIEGAAGIAASVNEQRPGIEIFPVPMRVENSEKEKADRRKAFAQERFSRFPVRALGGEGRERYWGEVTFPYVAFYAYEEVLATFGDKPGETTSLLAAAERLTGFLTGGDVRALVPASEAERQRIVHLYARNSALPRQTLTPEQLASRAEEVMGRLDPVHVEAAYRVFTRMLHVSREGTDSWVALPLSAFEAAEREAIHRLDGTALRVQPDETNGVEAVHLAHPAMGDVWERLRRWIVEDREFLLWRRRLAAGITEWKDSERDRGTLLRGARLRAAVRRRRESPQRLSDVERAFILASEREHRRRLMLQILGGYLLVGLLSAAVYYPIQSARSQRHLLAQQEELARVYQDSLRSTRAGSLLAAAQQNFDRGNFVAAIAAFDTTLALRPGDPAALNGRARARHDQGDFAGAISDFSQVLQEQPQNAEALYWRASARIASGDTTRSIEDLRQALQAARDSAQRTEVSQRLESVLATRGGVVVDTAARVLVYYQAQQDIARARTVGQELGRAGYRVQAVEYRAQPSPGDMVRYFHTEDEAQAGFVARTVQRALGEAGVRVRVRSRSLQGRYQAPRGQIEVWIPELAKAASTTGP